MRTFKCVKINPDDALQFVELASRCGFDIDVSNAKRKMTVDAKSILGVMALNFSSPLIVSYSGSDSRFEQFLALKECS